MGLNAGTATAYLLLDKKNFDTGLSSAKKGLGQFGDSTDVADGKLNKFGSSFGRFASGALAVGGTALAGATAAVGALVKASVQGYAEYEQLVGGVETLFGAGGQTLDEYAKTVGMSVADAKSQYETLMASQSTVIANAGSAWKTAGMSANEYMTTATSFAASLLQSLEGDTVAAADAANSAVIDMSDNANKMGTSMEMIQNAYQGFAKGNYTMLDNLKLGYGGTQAEMQRLLDDASALSGIEYDMSNLDDVYSAIHVVQTEMGITGTTAKEAATTIQGSTAAMKSAWANLVTGMGDSNADLGTLIDNFVQSVGTVAQNIIPIAKQALLSIGKLVTALAPMIATEIPKLITDVLPSLVDAASQLLMALVNGLITCAPQLLTAALGMIQTLANGLIQNLPTLIPAIVDIVLQLVDTLVSNVDMLVDTAIQLMMALAEGIINALPILIEKAPEIIIKLVGAIIENAPKLLMAAVQLIAMLVTGLGNGFATLYSKVATWVETKIVQPIKDKISEFFNVGANIVTGIWDGMKSGWGALTSWFTGALNSLTGGVKKSLGINSPSKVYYKIAGSIIEGLVLGMENGKGEVASAVDGLTGDMNNRFGEGVDKLANKKLTLFSIPSYTNGLDYIQSDYLDNFKKNEQVSVAEEYKNVNSAAGGLDMLVVPVKIGEDVITTLIVDVLTREARTV